MTVCQGILLIEKATGNQVQPANVGVLRVHAQDQNIAFFAPARGEELVQIKHRRGSLDSGHLLLDCAHIVHCQIIAHRRDAGIRQPRILCPDQVRPNVLNGGEHISSAGKPDGHHQDQ